MKFFLLPFWIVAFNIPFAILAETPYRYTFYKEVITVNGEEEGYHSEVTYRGLMAPASTSRVNISYSELEEISDIQVVYFSGKKTEKLKKKDIGNDMLLTGTFYSGYRSYFFNLPQQPFPYTFEYSYTHSTKTLMLLSKLFLNSQIPTDTIIYEIRIPKQLRLLHNIEFGNSTTLVFSEKETSDYTIYTFSNFPAGPVEAAAGDRFIYPNFDLPYVDLVVLPAGVEDGFDYFNDWYLKLVEPREHINEETRATISRVTQGATSEEEKVRLLYDFVRDKITYIDIENGIGAFQPRDPNDILIKKQGDCKDMANLLCQGLRYLGFDARMAISSSLSHITDLHFPNLSSANHAICVVRLNDEWVYLDATDPYVDFGFPSRHTQDRNIFIVDHSGGELHKIKHVAADKNLVANTYHLKKTGKDLSGGAKHQLYGLSMADIRSLTTSTSEQAYLPLIQKYLSAQSKNLLYDQVELADYNDSMVVQSRVASSNNFLAVDGRNYLSLKFLQFPHIFPQEVDSSSRLITYQAVNNQFEYYIQLDEPGKLIKPISENYTSAPFKFHFEVAQDQPDLLKITYKFVLDAVVLEGEELKNFNALNKLIQSTLSQSVIYESL